MNYTVIDPVTLVNFQEHPTAASIIAVMSNSIQGRMNDSFRYFSNDEEQVSEHFRHGYVWHDKQNQQQAQQILRGALIAHRHQYHRQVSLYKEALFKVVTNDMAVAARAVIQQHPRSYKNFLYYYPDEEPIPEWEFSVPSQTRGLTLHSYEWCYVPLDQFHDLIPLHALEILEILEQNRLTPQAYWVADEREIVRQISVDPVLCAQYGRWFVGIAQWE